MYTFVNRNYLVPLISNYNNLNEALSKLQNETIYRYDGKYNQNVYVVEEIKNINMLYYSDGNSIFVKNLTSNDNPVIYYKYNDRMTVMGFDYIGTYKSNIVNTDNDMNITFQTNVNTNNVIIDDKQVKNVFFKLDQKKVETIENKTNLECTKTNLECTEPNLENSKLNEDKKKKI